MCSSVEILLVLLGADGGLLEGLLGGDGLAGGADLLHVGDDLHELAGAAGGDVLKVGADGGDGLSGELGISDGVGPLAADLGGHGDLLLALHLDDGGVLGDEAGVALGPVAGVVEGVGGQADLVTDLEVLAVATDEEPLEVGGVGHFSTGELFENGEIKYHF